ncbi:hypothetical protein [Desulfolutivibrio sulfoxidireducens]|uniref:hypothetical protein n=1 Tax=Desulfolutivibrio sulfoxidireducens TaxID=2773299 RepID=UPI00159E7682|nr:hypothetical protein [Desulfolutivibrio sulfoxidireducens]QLA18959.1 hypothetical protein GD604_04015 [Desulfolutivibrio sulfoxidireducens]
MDQDQNQNTNPDQSTSGNGPEKNEKTVPYARFQAVNDAKKQAEETLTGLVAELLEDIPEDMRDVVPDLPPAQKIKWLRAAQKKGLFTAKQEPTGPDSKRPGGKPATDFNGMSAQEKMAHGYGQTK